MFKQIPERITYAQEKLIRLIQERKLRRWCLENGFSHSTVYRLATGDKIPVYSVLCMMSNIIAPIDWLFYTDESLPYERETVPPLPKDCICRYVAEHKNYREMAARFSLSPNQARNIFEMHRTKPTLAMIREACSEVNPIEFFTDSGEKDTVSFIPDRGDIVSIKDRNFLVISGMERNKENRFFTVCPLGDEADGIPVPESEFGNVLAHRITTLPLRTYVIPCGHVRDMKPVTAALTGLIEGK